MNIRDRISGLMVRTIIRKNKYRISDVSDAIGIKKSTMTRIVQGRKSIDLDSAYNLIHICGVKEGIKSLLVLVGSQELEDLYQSTLVSLRNTEKDIGHSYEKLEKRNIIEPELQKQRKKSYGEIVRQMVLRKGITQKQASKVLDVEEYHFNRIIRGEKALTLKLASKIVNYFEDQTISTLDDLYLDLRDCKAEEKRYDALYMHTDILRESANKKQDKIQAN